MPFHPFPVHRTVSYLADPITSFLDCLILFYGRLAPIVRAHKLGQ